MRISCTEIGRLEWRLTDSGDAAAVTEDFLRNHGFPVADLSAGRASESDLPPTRHAIMHVSAAACAVMAGGADGRDSPSPDLPDIVIVVRDGDPRSMPEPTNSRCSVGRWESSWTRAQHAEAVAAVRDAIAKGDVYQVNVVGHQSATYAGDPCALLQRVIALPGSRYPFALHGVGWALASASPETLIHVRDGRVVTKPIKGTQPATAAGLAELRGSEKERAEHVMIVDLGRNDLARVAEVGSVRVDELFAIKRWSGLWQAESTVSARLAPGTGLAAVLRAACPGGSVTGAPKLAALAQIAALEPVGRGPSMGVLGMMSAEGLDLGLTIRTVAADADRLHLWAGGGITWGSDPYAEVAEAEAKAAPIRALLGG